MVEEGSSGGMGMSWFGGGSTTWNWEGRFLGIQSLAFDQFGRLHALDSYQDNVQILDPVSGTYINHYNAFLEDTGAHKDEPCVHPWSDLQAQSLCISDHV